METIQFNELAIAPEILKALESMGFEGTTPIQAGAIPPLLEGKDVTAQAPTGTGKTCAFGIPLIQRIDIRNPDVQALVLCPTRELAIQITAAFQKISRYKPGIRTLALYGGQRIERQIMALKRRPQVIVATPGRIMDHIRRKTVRLSRLSTVVLDEADRMLDMGFRDDINTILQSVPEERQTVLFSATLPTGIRDIAKTYQNNAVSVKVEQKELTAVSVDQFYLDIRHKNKPQMLEALLKQEKYRVALVFCNTKAMTDQLSKQLSQNGIRADALHGDMRQNQRDQVMARYRRGAVSVLVATDVAARGIDVYDIEAVVNYDIPQDSDSYVHRIGRTGRADKTGIAFTFVYPWEKARLREIVSHTKSPIQPFRLESEPAGGPELTNADKMSVPVRERGPRQDRFVKPARRENSSRENGARDETIRPSRDNGAAPKKRPEPTKGMSRMFISLGKFDRMKKSQLAELLIEQTNVPAGAIGGIEMYDQYSFFDLSPRYAEEVISGLDGSEYRGRRLSVQTSRKKRKDAPRAPRTPRAPKQEQ